MPLELEATTTDIAVERKEQAKVEIGRRKIKNKKIDSVNRVIEGWDKAQVDFFKVIEKLVKATLLEQTAQNSSLVQKR